MVDCVKLIVLNDNEPAEGLLNDWGWSVFVDLGNYRFLFDANTDPEVLRVNAYRLGIDLRKLDFAVLSHWHWDHYGGMKYIGEVAPGLKVYVPPGEITVLRDWGLNPEVINKPSQIIKDVITTGPLGITGEQAIGIAVGSEDLVVLVGCSHPGVDFLTKKLKEATGRKIHLIIGGFHLPPREVLDEVSRIAEFVSPAHCSGEAAKAYVKSKYPEKYVEVRTGSIIKAPLTCPPKS